MGKNPAFQFYPSDWTRDLDDLDIQIEGAWIRIICRLWWSNQRGTATKSLQEWSNILRKTQRKTKEILQILIEKRVADGSILDNQNITIISRRMVNDFRISQLRKEVGKLGGNPKLKKSSNFLVNQTDNQIPTPSSSSSNKEIYKEKSFEVISYLNEKTGKKYRDTAAIEARLKDGGTVEECKTIIDNKLKDPYFIENKKYLNPQTLFRKIHWDIYLNEVVPEKDKSWI